MKNVCRVEILMVALDRPGCRSVRLMRMTVDGGKGFLLLMGGRIKDLTSPVHTAFVCARYTYLLHSVNFWDVLIFVTSVV